MSEQELLVALARRMEVVKRLELERIQHDFEGPPGRIPARAFMGVQTAVARECLRQMEWTRRQAMDDDLDRPVAIEDARAFAAKVPLTLAPPEWKP